MSRTSIGTVYEVTTTSNFVFMLNEDISKENLVFGYVEIDSEDNELIIARILDVRRENPLLSRDLAGMLNKQDLISELTLNPLSERFTYGYAECEVVGALNSSGRLELNRRSISPSSTVYTISDESIKTIFSSTRPSHIPIGKIESFGSSNQLITLNGDELVTKHFAVFGMTGSGKTTSAAKILEELMMRNQRMIIFDPHNDYQNIDNFNLILDDKSINLEELRNIFAHFSINLEVNKIIPLFKTCSIIWGNLSLWDIIPEKTETGLEIIIDGNPVKFSKVDFIQENLNQSIVDDIISSDIFIWNSKFDSSNQSRLTKHFRLFPELKYYGDGYEDFTITLLGGFLNEQFPSAQLRRLRDVISDQSLVNRSGVPYLQRLWSLINSNYPSNDNSAETLKNKINIIQRIYEDSLEALGLRSNTDSHNIISRHIPEASLDFLATEIASRQNDSSEPNIYRFSLSDFTPSIRKTTVSAIIEYVFRLYKFNKTLTLNQNSFNFTPSDRYPILFVLEEARSLVAKANKDEDFAGWSAVNSVRNLAYEGRKFKLSYGIISQKPSNVDEEIGSQCNTLIIHQLKNPDDQLFVRHVTEGLSLKELDMIKNIGTGKAIITGTGIKSTALITIEKRYSVEGLEYPAPLSEEIERAILKKRSDLSLDL